MIPGTPGPGIGLLDSIRSPTLTTMRRQSGAELSASVLLRVENFPKFTEARRALLATAVDKYINSALC